MSDPEKLRPEFVQQQEQTEKPRQPEQATKEPHSEYDEFGWLKVEDRAEQQYQDAQELKGVRAQLGTSGETEKTETGQKQSQRIFDNVYEQLKSRTATATPEQAGRQFVDGLAHGERSHIKPIEDGAETNQQVFAEIKSTFDRTAKESLVRRYFRDKWYQNQKAGGAELEWAKPLAYDTSGNPKKDWWTSDEAQAFFRERVVELDTKNAFQSEAVLQNFIKDRPDLIQHFGQDRANADKLYNRLTTAVNNLVKNGEVDPLTAKVFLKTLPTLKSVGDYNAVVRNDTISNEDLATKNLLYRTAVETIWQQQPAATKHDQEGGFYQFNSHLVSEQGHTVKNRVYVSAELSKAPEQVVGAWMAALDETGLRDKIYFKFPTGLSKRFESVVLYQTDKTSEADMEKLLTAFGQKCPEQLLNQRDMPSAVPLRRGIAMAPEPANINAFLENLGSQKNISYNELIAGLSQLSFELAYHENTKSDSTTVPNPRTLKEPASRYFEKLIRLSGINPDTMVPNSQGGKLPTWAERIAA